MVHDPYARWCGSYGIRTFDLALRTSAIVNPAAIVDLGPFRCQHRGTAWFSAAGVGSRPRNVGLVLGVEMSRLARSCRDWHQLLEICALFDTLIADTDGAAGKTLGRASAAGMRSLTPAGRAA